MIEAAKFIHAAAVAFWSAGLIALPFLYLQRNRELEGEPLHALHRFVRFLYVRLLSPAAFVAIASGIALIFLRQPYVPWFSVKLLLVGLMVLLHVTSGLLILNLFDPGRHYTLLRAVVSGTLNVTVVTAIIAIVLAKPTLFQEPWFAEFFAPGALGEIGGKLIGEVI